MKAFMLKYRYALWLVPIIVLYCGYFVLQNTVEPTWTVHCALDDMIPFCKWFIIPYLSWFLYISVPMIWVLIRSKNDLIRMVMFLLVGLLISHAIFWVFPSEIAFRPVPPEGGGLINAMVRFIFNSDKPRIVFPSLHCFEALAIHITLTKSAPAQRHRRWLIPLSLVISLSICLSTMFIKQHSVLDFIAAAALVPLAYLIVYKIDWSFLREGR